MKFINLIELSFTDIQEHFSATIILKYWVYWFLPDNWQHFPAVNGFDYLNSWFILNKMWYFLIVIKFVNSNCLFHLGLTIYQYSKLIFIAIVADSKHWLIEVSPLLNYLIPINN